MTSAHSAQAVLAGLDGIRQDLVSFYRDLYEHPELSHQETETAGKVADRLRAAGYDVTTGVGGTGVVGILANGDGPRVLLRADMDALPVREATGLDYASTVIATDASGESVPVMHACGHDVHVACLATAATLLAAAKDQWSGTLIALFSRPRKSATAPAGCWRTACVTWSAPSTWRMPSTCSPRADREYGGLGRSDLTRNNGLQPDDDHRRQHDRVHRRLRHRPVRTAAVHGDPHAVRSGENRPGAGADGPQ